jgi:hypothetical protein
VALSVDGSMETGNATRVFSTAAVRGGSLRRPEGAPCGPSNLKRHGLQEGLAPKK